MPALVRDVQGNAVYGLQATDFSIKENRVDQPGHLDEAAEADPVSVVVALQIGGRARREFSRIRGLSGMMQPIFGQPNAQVALVEFDSKVHIIQDFTHTQVLDTARGSNRDEWQPMPDLLAPLAMTLATMRKNIPRIIASMPGGEYELFSSRKSFETKMTSFSNHLHGRYLLSFEPKSPHPGLHEIHVTLKEPSTWTVLFRTSYWAQAVD